MDTAYRHLNVSFPVAAASPSIFLKHLPKKANTSSTMQAACLVITDTSREDNTRHISPPRVKDNARRRQKRLQGQAQDFSFFSSTLLQANIKMKKQKGRTTTNLSRQLGPPKLSLSHTDLSEDPVRCGTRERTIAGVENRMEGF